MNINSVPPTIKSEYPYRGKRINMRCDWVDCNLESGLILREVVEHPGAVVIIPLGEDNQITLVKQYRHSVGSVLLECPAGTREPQEEPLITAMRELSEEAHLEAKEWKSLGILYPVPGFSTEKQEIFLAKGLTEKTANRDPGEFIEIHQFTLDQIKQMIKNFEIVDAKTIASIYRAELMGLFES